MGTLTSHAEKGSALNTHLHESLSIVQPLIKHDHRAGFRIRKNIVTYLFITTVQFQLMVMIYTSYIYKNWIFTFERGWGCLADTAVR